MSYLRKLILLHNAIHIQTSALRISFIAFVLPDPGFRQDLCIVWCCASLISVRTVHTFFVSPICRMFYFLGLSDCSFLILNLLVTNTSGFILTVASYQQAHNFSLSSYQRWRVDHLVEIMTIRIFPSWKLVFLLL